MWDLMGSQFEESGRQKVPALLGFDQDRIVQEDEKPKPSPQPASFAPVEDEFAEDFFEQLAAKTEQKEKAEKEAEAAAAMAALQATEAKASEELAKTTNDWSSGPEALIKQSLLVGNLTAAVECCFKSGRMAEGLLLASG